MNAGTLTLCACAKLNLYLDITGRRGDGYHLLETVMQSVDLCDIVTVRLNVLGISVGCSDPGIPAGEANICHKAARVFFERAGVRSGADIMIQKRIPSGAGMGGGSADAAAVLFGLNTLCGSLLSESELLSAAAEVGADVPFCLVGGTRLCRGIGEVMTELPAAPDCCFLVAKPEHSCPTGEAFARYDTAELSPRGIPEEYSSGMFPHEKMYNVFRALYDDERLERLVEKMMAGGALGAELTGSGSAVFGVFPDELTAERAARNFADIFTAVCRPTAYGVKII